MKTGFKNKIEPKEGKKIKNPWNFDQPPYDERSSCYLNAGTDYGVGHAQPVGSEGSGKVKDAIPKGRVNTLESDYIHRGRPQTVEIPEE